MVFVNGLFNVLFYMDLRKTACLKTQTSKQFFSYSPSVHAFLQAITGQACF